MNVPKGRGLVGMKRKDFKVRLKKARAKRKGPSRPEPQGPKVWRLLVLLLTY